MRKQKLSHEATIYNYTLIRKIPHRSFFFLLYAAIPIPLIIWEGVHYSWMEGVSILLAYVLVQFLHLLIVLGFAQFHKTPLRGTWTFIRFYPWVGYLPSQMISLSKVKQIHLHLMFMSLFLIVALYPWVQTHFWSHLIFCQFWILLPRFVILQRFKANESYGWMIIKQQDTSYYVQ